MKSKIHLLKYLLSSENLSPEFIEMQKKYFGFSIFSMSDKKIHNTLKEVLHNRRNILSRVSTLFLIPHVYIFPLVFGGVFLRIIIGVVMGLSISDGFFNPDLRFIMSCILYALIILALLFITRAIQKIIQSEMKEFYSSLIIYNKDYDTIKQHYNRAHLNKGISSFSQTKNPPFMNFLKKKGSTFVFAISQPFIFGHGWIFGGFSLLSLVTFDVFIFLILFNYLSPILFSINMMYYKIKLFIIQYLPGYIPFIFSKEIQERYFFQKLYDETTQLSDNIDLLEKNISLAEDQILDKHLGKGLSKSISQVGHLYSFIKKSTFLLSNNKNIFSLFLKNLVNEIIDRYLVVFDVIESKISSSSQGKENTYSQVSKQRIDMNKRSLLQTREKLEEMKI